MEQQPIEPKTEGFSTYQKFVIAVLSFIQFTIILDFMVLSPLGAILMPALHITPSQFGLVVSVYAFSAGTSGIIAAGFSDRFDRKKWLLFFYVGFILGTLFCGLAPTYPTLLAARLITGLFGGVIGSIVFAITTDLFPMHMRGRVMGFVQTAFAASQVLGLPFALFLSNHWGWHIPFMMIVVVSAIAGGIMWKYLLPIDGHLKLQKKENPFHHLLQTLSKPSYLQAFAATALLSTGGFMLMPFSSAFNVHNVGISFENLPILYMITGVCSILVGPYVGKISDSIGKFKVFALGSLLTIIIVMVYTHLGITPFALLILISALMFIGVNSRMISSSALISGIPEPMNRGSFMSINSSVQQLSGGLAAILAGFIVQQSADGSLINFDVLGDVVITFSIITVVMMYFVNRRMTVAN